MLGWIRLLAAMAAFWMLAPAAALACTYPRPIILSAPPAAVEGFTVVKVRIVNGLWQEHTLVALESVVVEDSAGFGEGAQLRFIVPDGWLEGASCLALPWGDTLDDEGRGIGYVQIRGSDLPGFYILSYPSSRNEGRLKRARKAPDWRAIRFGEEG
ncbi:hypothetical protein LY632_14175 [Erythrobacter sp. SDW2]|uniref:hypothetical protein n=1 Tax=Erythrobacter sp. SDW2 TaxID=2907154 RepID=UPI001F3EDCA1|nr:hypothetical protein [Erythrobacter sp. SDW2]UIP06798.1 hypothetical protein LY632_14175 [Erythrobacter sp. SDW2]